MLLRCPYGGQIVPASSLDFDEERWASGSSGRSARRMLGVGQRFLEAALARKHDGQADARGRVVRRDTNRSLELSLGLGKAAGVGERLRVGDLRP